MFSLAMLSAFALCSDPSPDVEYKLGINSWTDVLTPVSFNRVMFTQGAQSRTYLTDPNGSTSLFAVVPETPFTLTLKQVNTPSGITVGQVLSSCSIPTAVAGEDASNHIFLLFQPVMEPVLLDSSNPRPVQSESHDRWFLWPNEGASFLSTLNIGMLMTPREIAALEGYYGVPLAQGDYRAGLAIWAADPCELGNVGARLLMRFDSYGFDAAPGVDGYFVANRPEDLGTADYEVVPSGWEDGIQRADYDLRGTLGKGLNLLLFREGPSSDLAEFVATTPTFPPPMSQPRSLAQVQNCDPDPPLPSGGESCPITPPPSDPGCPASDCMGPPYCTTTYVKAGRFCGGGPGEPDGKDIGVTTTISGGVSPRMTVMGVEVTPSVGVSRAESEVVHAGVGPGAFGCGQCSQVWKEIVMCTTPCIIEKNAGRTLSGAVLCLDADAPGQCIDTSNTSTTRCDRTGC